MRTPLIIFLLLLMPFVSKAQYRYISLGYNANYLSSEKLDFVIDRYNETRTYLDETMGYPHFYDGFDLHVGGGEVLLLDFGYSWRSAYVFSSGTDATGTLQQRDLKYKFGTFDIGFGYNIINSDVKFTVGYTQTFGSEKAFSRVAEPGEIDNAKYEDLFEANNPGGEIYMQFLLAFTDRTGLLLKPYFHFSYKNSDYASLNEELNPATASMDDPILTSRLSGFGVSASIAFGSFY